MHKRKREDSKLEYTAGNCLEYTSDTDSEPAAKRAKHEKPIQEVDTLGKAAQKYTTKAALKGSTPLIEAIKDDNFAAAKYLVTKLGTNINSTTHNGATALIIAASECEFEIVRFLVENGADINYTSKSGNTALMYAAQGGSVEIVRFLAEKGANINATNASGDSALMKAAANGHMDIVKWLLKNSAVIKQADQPQLDALGLDNPKLDKIIYDHEKNRVEKDKGKLNKLREELDQLKGCDIVLINKVIFEWFELPKTKNVNGVGSSSHESEKLENKGLYGGYILLQMLKYYQRYELNHKFEINMELRVQAESESKGLVATAREIAIKLKYLIIDYGFLDIDNSDKPAEGGERSLAEYIFDLPPEAKLILFEYAGDLTEEPAEALGVIDEGMSSFSLS
ncbi:MAG: hypothetical protein Tsb006_7980 [Rickettsiaceae bacterium]